MKLRRCVLLSSQYIQKSKSYASQQRKHGPNPESSNLREFNGATHDKVTRPQIPYYQLATWLLTALCRWMIHNVWWWQQMVDRGSNYIEAHQSKHIKCLLKSKKRKKLISAVLCSVLPHPEIHPIAISAKENVSPWELFWKYWMYEINVIEEEFEMCRFLPMTLLTL